MGNELDNLTEEQKAQVDKRVEANVAQNSPLKSLGPAIKYYPDGESDPDMVSPGYYGISEDPEVAALQSQAQQATGKASPARPKAERWYLSPGQKPMGDPAQYRNIGGATPIEAPPETTQGADGKWRTAFGGKVRVTDKDGNVSWEDASGNAVEKPKSMQMMEAMNRGYSPNQGTAKSWDDAIQQSNENPDGLTAAKAMYDKRLLKQRNRLKAEHDLATADTAARALDQLRTGGGEVKQSKDGNFYRIVRFGAEDEGGPVADANATMSMLGKKSRLKSIIAAIQVDKDGNPVDGAKPQLRMGVETSGGVNGKSPVVIKSLDIGRVMNQFAKAWGSRYGKSAEESQKYTYNRFGGKDNLFGDNPLGWKLAPSEQEKYNDTQAVKQQELGLKQQEMQQKGSQFDRNYDLLTRQFEASEKHADARDALAQKQFDEGVKQTIRNANRDDMKLAYEIVTGLQNAGKGMTTGDILKSMGDDTIEQFYKVPMVNPDGTPVTDVNGAQMFRPPQTKEEYDRCTEGLVNAVNALRGANGGASIRDNYAKLTAVRGAISGEPSAPAGGSSTGGAILTPAGQLGGAQGGGEFREIPPDEFARLSPEQQAQYKAMAKAAWDRGWRPGGAAATQGSAQASTQANDATAGAGAQSGASPLPPLGASATQAQVQQPTQAQAQQPTQAAPSAPEQKTTQQFDEEQLRKRRNGIKADFVRRYKTVQDVARDVVRTLNANGELDSIVNPDGTRRTDLTPQEESDIIYNVRRKFRDAGMSDFWNREVAGISPNNPGGLTRKAILDRLFRDWNNMKAPLEYGNRRIQAQ